ncbi:MAG: HAD family phosphatase [Simkaniaceae bacterium]|nr:HAD family phosphatase [Simkaniaceae bacterium]
MEFFEQFDFICFDFDGLLVNTEKLHYQAYKTMLKNRGCDLKATFIEFASVAHKSAVGIRAMIYSIFPSLQKQEPNWDVLYKEKTTAYLNLLKLGKLELLPGVNTLLQELSALDIRRCVVTNSTKEQVDLIRKHLPELNSIPHFVTREDYKSPKPAPDAYLKAIELYGKPQDRIVGFEDAMRGIDSLKQAEILPVLICPENHPQLESVSEDLLYCASFTKFLNL